MKRYLAVFTGSPSAMARWETIPEAERQKKQAQGVTAWKNPHFTIFPGEGVEVMEVLPIPAG